MTSDREVEIAAAGEAAEVRPNVSAARLPQGCYRRPLRRGVGSAAGFQRLAHRNLGEHHDTTLQIPDGRCHRRSVAAAIYVAAR